MRHPLQPSAASHASGLSWHVGLVLPVTLVMLVVPPAGGQERDAADTPEVSWACADAAPGSCVRLQEEAGGDGGADARSFFIEGTMDRVAEPTASGEPAEPVPTVETDEEAAEPAQPDQEAQSPVPTDSPGSAEPADSATPEESAGPAEPADTAETGPTDPVGTEEPQAAGPAQPSTSETEEDARADSTDPPAPAPAGEKDTNSDEGQVDSSADEVEGDGAEVADTGAEPSAPAMTPPSTDAQLPDSGSDREQPERSGGEDDPQARDGSGPSSSAPADSTDSRERPSSAPVPPVSDTSQLSADNAGALSGTRRGNAVVLMIPRDRASAGDWVSVFVLPDSTRSLSVSDSTSSGWLQIDSSNSVTVDISGLGCGTYRLVVADSDNVLLGWARLEIQEGSFGGDNTGAAYVVPGEAAVTETFRVGPEDWMLLGSGMLLVVGVAGFLLVARPGVLRSVVRVAPRLGRRG